MGRVRIIERFVFRTNYNLLICEKINQELVSWQSSLGFCVMGYTVALTGGIGSGKSTIANEFLKNGVSVVDADVIARQVVEPGAPALRAIAAHFGPETIQPDGTLNRRLLRERIFASPDDKRWLNALLHPLIHAETQRQIAEATSPYVLWVVPLLVENQLHTKADRVLVVDVSPETQISLTSPRRHKFPARWRAMALRVSMPSIFLPLRPREKPVLPSRMTLLTIMAHQMPLHRMLPACMRRTYATLPRSYHRKNRNAHPRPF